MNQGLLENIDETIIIICKSIQANISAQENYVPDKRIEALAQLINARASIKEE